MTMLTATLSAKLKVSRKLTIATPSAELVDAYLTEIAKAYSVNWSVVQPRPADSDDTPDGGATVGPIARLCYLPFLTILCTSRIKESTEEKAGISNTIPKASIASSSAGGRRTPKLPDIPPTEDEAEVKGKSAAAVKSSTPPPMYKAPPEDDFEALTRRFEALKKR